MIVHRAWTILRRINHNKDRPFIVVVREGWFLFGVLPLYVRDQP